MGFASKHGLRELEALIVHGRFYTFLWEPKLNISLVSVSRLVLQLFEMDIWGSTMPANLLRYS